NRANTETREGNSLPDPDREHLTVATQLGRNYWSLVAVRRAGRSEAQLRGSGGGAAAPEQTVEIYRDQRKFRTSCFCDSLSKLNRPITLLASDDWYLGFPTLLCAWMACRRSVVRPSCRKKMRWPRP